MTVVPVVLILGVVVVVVWIVGVAVAGVVDSVGFVDNTGVVVCTTEVVTGRVVVSKIASIIIFYRCVYADMNIHSTCIYHI